ncbi:protein singed wings 2 isoform X2 [Photinus pyralis]|nr:protein singed wings 2 isoform X2 [Photinus pyralis]XP_031354439.1 protein singed wings 2 isoform X2 [Photinus pyralis]
MMMQQCSPCRPSSGCQHFPNTNTYSCSGRIWKENHFDNLTSDDMMKMRTLEMCNVNKETLNLHKINTKFPYLRNITIWQGNISSITNSVLPQNQIKVLQLRDLKIELIPTKFLVWLTKLEVLDLSGNSLQRLDEKVVRDINRISFTNLSNNHWNCSLNMDWVEQLKTTSIYGVDNMTCYQPPYQGKPIIPIAEFKKNVRTMCPERCSCTMSDVVRDPHNFELEPIIEVNCSNKNFLEFPPTLPNKTKTLALDKNQIRSLMPLVTNPLYKDVQDLDLDNNFIDSIEDLEGSYWFSHFRVLSLRNNQLVQVPTYALDNALQQNPNMPEAVRLFLGENPWKCDCSFIPSFQDLLRKYQSQVEDIADVKCSPPESDKKSPAMIITLSRSAVCRLPNDYAVNALDMVNGILASLIILILGKLAYDYYHFKRTGRLPWIVTKIP